MPSVKTLLNKILGKTGLLAGLPVHLSQLHSENTFQGEKEILDKGSLLLRGFLSFWVRLSNCFAVFHLASSPSLKTASRKNAARSDDKQSST